MLQFEGIAEHHLLLKKAINLYNVSNITIMNGEDQDDIIDDGLAQMDLNKYSDARETFQSFTKRLSA